MKHNPMQIFRCQQSANGEPPFSYAISPASGLIPAGVYGGGRLKAGAATCRMPNRTGFP